jgi:hypothetical protein
MGFSPFQSCVAGASFSGEDAGVTAVDDWPLAR